MTTPTKLPIPSNNLLDSRFNFEKLDQIVNSDANYYIDRFGKQRLTVKGLESLADQISIDLANDVAAPDGFRMLGKATSFAQLRSITPLVDGQRILLNGYNEGSSLGGGEFIAHFGTATDDGGIVASGTGFYWKRVFNESVNPVWFGYTYGKTNSVVAVLQKIIDLGYLDIDLLGLDYGVDGPISITSNNTNIRNGRIFVMDSMTSQWVFGLNAQYCTFSNLWADLNGTVAAGVFSSVDPIKGVSGVTPCESLINNRGISHYTKIIDTYVTRSAGGKPAFSFPGVDQCLHVSVVNCTVEFSGSMFFTMSGYNEVINPRCLNINDAGIAFNTGGAKNCVVRGGFVHNCRYGGIAVESGAHDILIDGVTFTQPQSGNSASNFVVQRGDILISSFTTASADCYNIDIINCKFSQGSNYTASTGTSYKQSIYIVNGYNINIRNNTFNTAGFSNDNTEANNAFIYCNPGISRRLDKVNIEDNFVNNGVLLKIWSSVDAQMGEILLKGNHFDSLGYVVQVVGGNTTAYYPGAYTFGIRAVGNIFNTTKIIAGTSQCRIYQYSEWINNWVPSGTLSLLDGTQNNGLSLRQIKFGNMSGEYLSDTIPTVGTWKAGDRIVRPTVAPSGNIGWICVTSGTFATGTWTASTAYTLGTRITSDGNAYEAIVAGTSGSTAPSRTTANGTETDGTVTWKFIGKAAPTFVSLGTYSAT